MTEKRLSRYTAGEICKVINTDRKQFKEKIRNLGKKVVERKRSFDDIDNEFHKNERDMQLFFKGLRTHLSRLI